GVDFRSLSRHPDMFACADHGDAVGRAGELLTIGTSDRSRPLADRSRLYRSRVRNGIGRLFSSITPRPPARQKKTAPAGAVSLFALVVQCGVRPPAASSPASGVTGTFALSSSQTIGTGGRTSALETTSSSRATGMMFIPPLIASEISVRSLALSSG